MEEIVPHVVKMVLEQGRMKFTLASVQGSVQERDGKARGGANVRGEQGIYHPICAKMVARDLELEE